MESPRQGVSPAVAMLRGGRVVFANREMSQLSGYDAERILAMSAERVRAFIHPEDRDAVWRRYDECATDGSMRGLQEFRAIRRDGCVRWLRTYASPVVYRGQAVMQAVCIDVTERKQAEAQQRLTMDVLRLLNESGDSPELVSRLLAKIKDHAGVNVVGLRFAEGQKFSCCGQDGSGDAFLNDQSLPCPRGGDRLARCNAGGRTASECVCERMLRGRIDPGQPGFTANGSFWRSESSEPAALAPAKDPGTDAHCGCVPAGYESMALIPLRSGIEVVGLLQLSAHAKGRFTLEQVEFYEGLCAGIGIALKQRRAAEALRRSEQLHRMIAAHSPDFVFAQDPDLRYTWIGKPAAPLTPELVVGKTDEELLPPEQARPLTEFKRKLIAARTGGRTEIQFSLDGHPRWYDAVCQPLRDEAGRVIGLIGYARDVTDRRRTQEQAGQRQAELLHMSRLSMLGEMAAELAHELNQPLSAILTYGGACLRQAQSSTPDMNRLMRNQRRILEQALRAREVMRCIRTFARRSEPRMDRVPLAGIVTNAVEQVRWRMRRKSIALALKLEDDRAAILANAVQIGQAVVNILRNAVEAVERADSPSSVIVETRMSQTRQVQVVVSDTGPGVSPENLPRLFDPFFTTKPAGLGVGLSISRKIVEMHGGTLEAKRNSAGGMTFTMTLPLAPPRVTRE
jgi:two-component system sensor kinase FixL